MLIVLLYSIGNHNLVDQIKCTVLNQRIIYVFIFVFIEILSEQYNKYTQIIDSINNCLSFFFLIFLFHY